MKYYVMSARSDVGCPIGLADNGALFDKPYEDSCFKLDYGYFPWYSNPYKCELPVGACLISKYSEYSFDIRGLAGDLYIASNDFVTALNDVDHGDISLQPITVKFIHNNDIPKKQYNLIRLPSHSLEDVLDEDESQYSVEQGTIWVDKFVFKEHLALPIVRITHINAFQDTLFCSEEFLDQIHAKEMQGINIFELDNAVWTDPDNPLAYLFIDNYDPNDEVFPI